MYDDQLSAPYPNKCYLPFILYPPGMHSNHLGSGFLQKIDMDKPAGDFVLYVGVPFCRTRCKSCPYFISILPERDKYDREDKYIGALIRDIANWSKFWKWQSGKIRSIYIGGGTASILKIDNLKRVIDAIFNNYKIADDYELTLEGNARDFDAAKINYVAQSKINRISLGVQSFQNEILRVIGSPHAALESIRVIKAFQDAGLRNIQLDLMYNMPGHTMEIWQKDLQVLKELGIPHFTIYLYRIHNNTPQQRLITKGLAEKPQHPETPMVKAMYGEAKQIAESMGFNMYMVDHFCQPGYENMYNHWNWNVYLDTLAIGPGSYSYFDGYRLGTEADIEKYIAVVNEGEFLISTVTSKMSERVQRERYIIFALLYFSIDFEFYRNKFGTDLLTDFAVEINRLKDKGLLEVNNASIKLTELGCTWHTNVILEFFNEDFWEDKKSLAEPNWSLNGVMVDVGSKSRSYWLGN